MIGPAVMIGKARRWAAWPVRDKVLFALAWPLLGCSRLFAVSAPFQYVAPWLGAAAVAPWIPLADSRKEIRALSIGKAVRRASTVTPWRSNCLAQALTARILLGVWCVPYSIFFGVTRRSDAAERDFSAHAWVAAGKISVTGGSSFEAFTVVACFVSRAS
jgi:hypothetical protein